MRSIFIFTFLISLHAFSSESQFPQIIDATALKESVDPCDDFYEFSCGAWIEQTVIPSDRKAVYRQSTPMMDAVDVRLNQILESYAQGHFEIPATYATKLADFYKSCMSVDANVGLTTKFLKNKIEQIKKYKTSEDWARLVGELQLTGSSLFNMGSMQDYNDSETVLTDLSQAGIVLGNPSYYLDKDDKAIEIRVQYKKYVTQSFMLLGAKKEKAQKIAEMILRLETNLAQNSYSVTDQSDPDKVNHVMDFEGVKKLMPSFDWNLYFKTVGLSSNRFNVDEPEFFKNLEIFFNKTTQIEKIYYFTWLLVDRSASQVGGDFEKNHFAFWKTYMNGTKQMAPRWKTCTQATEDSLGYALSEAYVKTFDGAAIKEKTNSMIDEIKNMFVTDLNILSQGAEAWIDGATVSEAIAKAQAITRKVGAPDKFRNYDALILSSTNYLENAFAVSQFEHRRDMAKIGQPVDKTEWGMMPWEVNAYYDRSNNEFVFPFGILQPPSLDLTASDCANYGAFGGGTIGHELTHGFDSAGSKYDSHGNLKNWWSPQTQALFDQKAQCYADQASQYRIKEVNLNVDGRQTLEENLADQGGVKLGYMVVDKILKTRAEGPLWLGKYSERQQYWIAYAQSWCSKVTPEALRSQMTNDVHPPSEFRVNAVVMNRPEFATDFRCAAGRAMAPANRCSLW